MPNIYTFVDYTGFLTEVYESDLNFITGSWSSAINYYRYDVVNFGASRYVCTVANQGVSPPYDLQFNQNWSIIAFTSTGTGFSGTVTPGGGASVQMVEDVYSLAYRAYNIALTGTDLPTPGAVAPWVMEWIGHTYNIARAGTNAANSADRWGRDAFSIAVAGTNAANQAWSYAGQAWTIAVAGTNAANDAQDAADSAYSLALNALQTAWLGTLGGAGVPEWVMSWLGQTYNLARSGTDAADAAWDYAGQAFNIAVAGTNAANQADSIARQAFDMAVTGTSMAATAQGMALAAQLDAFSAWQYAGQAWGIAVAGTNAANQAYSLAQQALYMAWVGTSTPTPGPGGSGTVPSWVMDWLGHTYNLSVAGTNAANSADRWGRDAFHLAVVGTNAAAAAQADATEALDLISTLTTITQAGYQGTLIAFVGQVPGWKTDIELHIRDGIVTDVANSRYSVELFNHYDIGPVGTIAGQLHAGDRWGGTARILSWKAPDPAADGSQSRMGFVGGGIVFFNSAGTYGSYESPLDLNVSSWGTGWTDPWIVNIQGWRTGGTETFEEFPLGVVYGTNFTPAIGFGWSGTVNFS